MKQIVKDAKSKAWESFGKSLEENYRENQKLFYSTLKQIRKEKECPIKFIKDTTGNIITQKENILERWREYFSDLLEGELTEDTDKEPEKENTTENGQQESEEGNREQAITREELQNALKKMKMGKAPGYDGIYPEMLQHMGKKGRDLLLKILNKAGQQNKYPGTGK